MHLLEVNQPVEACLIALVGKCHVLEQQRHEGNQWRLQFAHKDTIRPMIATGIDKRFELLKDFAEFRGYLLPGLMQPRHGHIRQTHDNGKESIKILVLLAADGTSETERRKLIEVFHVKQGVYLLRGQLDEFTHQTHTLAETWRRDELGHNPVLHLVEAPQKDIQVGGNLCREEAKAENDGVGKSH